MRRTPDIGPTDDLETFKRHASRYVEVLIFIYFGGMALFRILHTVGDFIQHVSRADPAAPRAYPAPESTRRKTA